MRAARNLDGQMLHLRCLQDRSAVLFNRTRRTRQQRNNAAEAPRPQFPQVQVGNTGVIQRFDLRADSVRDLGGRHDIEELVCRSAAQADTPVQDHQSSHDGHQRVKNHEPGIPAAYQRSNS